MQTRKYDRIDPESVDALISSPTYDGVFGLVDSLQTFIRVNRVPYSEFYKNLVECLEKEIQTLNSIKDSIEVRCRADGTDRQKYFDGLMGFRVGKGDILRSLYMIRGYLEMFNQGGYLELITHHQTSPPSNFGEDIPIMPTKLSERLSYLGVDDVSSGLGKLKHFKMR